MNNISKKRPYEILEDTFSLLDEDEDGDSETKNRILKFNKEIANDPGVRLMFKELLRRLDVYRTIVKNSGDIIIIIDAEGRIYNVNSEATKQLGYFKQELIRASITQILTPDTREDFQKALSGLLSDPKRKKSDYYHIELIRKDGSVMFVKSRNYIVRSDTNDKLVSTKHVEISADKITEDLLHSFLERGISFDEMVEFVLFQAKILTGSESGYIEAISPVTNKYIYYPREKYEKDRIFSGTFKDTVAADKTEMFNLLIPIEFRGELMGKIVLMNKERDYTNRDSESVKRLIQFLTIGLVFERKEEEKAAMTRELHHAQKLKALGAITSGVVHEFNNMLTCALGNLELARFCILENREKKVLGVVVKSISDAKIALEQGKNLTRQLTSLARKGEFKLENFGLNSCIRSLLNVLRPVINKNVELSLLVDAEIDTIQANKGAIMQILINLVKNASDAMLPNGGKIIVRTENIVFTSDNPQAKTGTFACLSVEDTGIGMDKETKCYLFDSFFTKGKKDGMGMGLSEVRKIVKQHGAWINVESKEGEGSTFYVYFPIVSEFEIQKKKEVDFNGKPNIDSGEGDKTKEEFMGNGERILVIEDNEVLRNLLTKIFSRNNYNTVAVGSGREALECFEKCPKTDRFDFVFCDRNLLSDDEKCVDLVKKLLKINPDVQVVFTTGAKECNPPTQEEEKFMAQFTMILKPYTPNGLLKKVKHVLSERGCRKSLLGVN